MSREANRRGHRRRLATDDTGCCIVEMQPSASAQQRFYAAYQYFRLEPGEPSRDPGDDGETLDQHLLDNAARDCAAWRQVEHADPLLRPRLSRAERERRDSWWPGPVIGAAGA